jgi:hypothetical protein
VRIKRFFMLGFRNRKIAGKLTLARRAINRARIEKIPGSQ